MATTPQSRDLLNEWLPLLETNEQPSYTFWVNPDTNICERMTDGIEAVKQTIEYTLGTERYQHLPFSSYYGLDLRNVVGQSSDYVISETLSRIQDAFLDDERIKSIELNADLPFTIVEDSVIINIDVTTVFGNIQTSIEVPNA